MIRIIYRNLSKKQLFEKKWDWHFACFHFKNYKNTYLNGKPLKPWHILRNGDVIEIFERPAGLTASIIGALIVNAIKVFVVAHPFITAGIVGVATTALGNVVNSIFSNNNSGSTQTKEYSSKSQPELRGASNDISDGCLPVLFGKIQQTPSYGQLPYRLVVDGASTNKYRQYFVANYNNVVYSDFKLGETPRTDYSIDYLDILAAYGTSNFIGFDNVKAVNADEELSYNPDETVNQNAHYDYNQQIDSDYITVNYTLQFSNVNLNSWSNKTFLQLTRVNQDGQKDLTTNITITSSMLTNQGNGTYTYNGSVTYEKGGVLEDNFSEIIYTNFAPTADTRGNSTETTNELDALYVSETVSAEGFTETETLNLSINRYQGTASEVVLTSPENTKEIDVIISFPSGLFHQNNNGSRSSRSVVVEIMYKQGDGEYVPFTENTQLYIRDINGVKQPLSSSTTTVDGANMTVKSPADMNVADQLFFRPIGFTLPSAGKYTVRVRSADYADKSNYDIGYPRCAEVQFYVNGDVLDKSI